MRLVTKVLNVRINVGSRPYSAKVPAHDFSKHHFTILGANGDEIQPCLRIIMALQPQGTPSGMLVHEFLIPLPDTP